MKSGERTDKADGHIQDRPRFLTGSMVSPPTHPKTNKGKLQNPVPRGPNLFKTRSYGSFCKTRSYGQYCKTRSCKHTLQNPVPAAHLSWHLRR